jgi:predicted nucleic acid-binding protein
MKLKAFLDTNILLDVLQQGRPFSEYSITILQAVFSCHIEALITTQSIVDASFIAKKAGYTDSFFETVKRWCNYINVDYISTFDINNAIRENSGDFEDDVQVARALDTCCDVFVTSDNNLRKHYNGKYEFLQFMSPEEFVSKLKGAAIPSQT